MRFAKRVLIVAGVAAISGFLITLIAPKAAHAVTALAAPHDSGPMRVATSHSYDVFSFTTTSPV
jgi:hypothetical protein